MYNVINIHPFVLHRYRTSFALHFSYHAIHETQSDEEPVDPLIAIREGCNETKPCAFAMSEYKVHSVHGISCTPFLIFVCQPYGHHVT